jgi:glycosyltransferase involved in cell wall biosynthesis
VSLRILFIVPYIPDLIRVRSYNFLRALTQRGHRVSVVAIDDGSDRVDHLEDFDRICEKLSIIALPRIRKALNVLRALPGQEPLQAAFAWQPRAFSTDPLLSKVEGRGWDFDLVHVEHMRGARYGLQLQTRLRARNLRTPIIFDSVDCLTALFQMTAIHAPRLASRWIARLERGRYERFEPRLASMFTRTLVTSSSDRSALIALDPSVINAERILVVPNGVDTTQFSPVPGQDHVQPTLIMTGKMSYHANEAMCHHFVEDILPLIWRSKPGVRLLIVGKKPPTSIRAFARDPRILVTGGVPEMSHYFRQAQVAVAPLVYGMGIQNKVLEAMACGLPVIATSQAVSALEVQNGREIIIEDAPQAFARKVVELLDAPERRARLAERGRKYVERNHDWNKVAERLEEIYLDVVNS